MSADLAAVTVLNTISVLKIILPGTTFTSISIAKGNILYSPASTKALSFASNSLAFKIKSKFTKVKL
jgi:hypothetical protein